MNTPHPSSSDPASQFPSHLPRDFASSTASFAESLAANTDWGGLTGDSDWQPCEQATGGLFARLQAAYQSTGGLLPAEEVARMMERVASGSWQSLGKMVSTRQLVQVRWQDSVWLPLFQFDRHENLAVKDRVRRVVVELRPAFDDWGIAQWFIEPNAWLGHRAPQVMVDRNLAMVMQAAQADRFVAGA